MHNAEQKGEELNRADVAASFQQAVVDVLVKNTIEAAKSVGSDKVAIAGGVSANTALRTAMQQTAAENKMSFYCPPLKYCTDNGAMISCAGYLQFIGGRRGGLDLNAVPQLSLN